MLREARCSLLGSKSGVSIVVGTARSNSISARFLSAARVAGASAKVTLMEVEFALSKLVEIPADNASR